MSDLETSGLQMSLGRFGEAVAARLRQWDAEDFGRRLWAKDHTLWVPEPVPELTDRMGWLELPECMQDHLDALERFAHEARAEGIEKVFVLGMGGSSLAPEVFARTFGATQILQVLDSTHPDAVAAAGRGTDPAKTLFLVSSKSGGTIETLSFFRFFWKLCSDRLSRILPPTGWDGSSRRSPIPARRWSAWPASAASGPCSMLPRRWGGATAPSRISAWCPRRSPGSTCAASWSAGGG